GHHGLPQEEREREVEEDAEQQRPHGQRDVGDRAAEVVAPLLLDDRRHVAERGHAGTASERGAAGGASARAASVVVRWRKISSRLMPTWCRASRSRPRETTARAMSGRTSRPGSASTSSVATPADSGRGRTETTPGTERTASAAAVASPRTSTRSAPAPRRRRVRFSGVSSATTLPLLMITTRPQ